MASLAALNTFGRDLKSYWGSWICSVDGGAVGIIVAALTEKALAYLQMAKEVFRLASELASKLSIL